MSVERPEDVRCAWMGLIFGAVGWCVSDRTWDDRITYLRLLWGHKRWLWRAAYLREREAREAGELVTAAWGAWDALHSWDDCVRGNAARDIYDVLPAFIEPPPFLANGSGER